MIRPEAVAVSGGQERPLAARLRSKPRQRRGGPELPVGRPKGASSESWVVTPLRGGCHRQPGDGRVVMEVEERQTLNRREGPEKPHTISDRRKKAT